MIEQKIYIKNLIYLILIILFLILLFTVISYEGRFYDAKKAYFIIKDSIGLAVAILTPFIAIQIYKGWIKKHKAISNEKITVEYYDHIKNLMLVTNVTPSCITQEKLKKTEFELSKSILFVEYLSTQLYGHYDKSRNLILNLNKLKRNLKDFQNNLISAFNTNKSDPKYIELTKKCSEKHNEIHDFSNEYTPLKI